jgi:C1A family cysteine protease
MASMASRLGAKAAYALPKAFALDTTQWTVHDQQSESSCVGYAASSAREHYCRTKGKPVELSPLFIYWWARHFENGTSVDGGSKIANAMMSLREIGVCEDKYMPNVPGTNSDVFIAPPSVSLVSAKNFIIQSYESLPDLDSIKLALTKGDPVVLGIPVYSGLESAKVTRSGVITLPDDKERLLGGHAIVAVGYDDSTELVKFHNSWGAKWGDKGYGYVPYQYLDENYFNAWVMKI